jgi:uncharacterized ferritin-like protein (DUF455 family)
MQDLPRTLQDRARQCLACSSVDEKLAATAATVDAFAAGELAVDERPFGAVVESGDPGRPTRPRLVDPRGLPRRGLGTPAGRAALVHAVAHIEFNAIDLAWDAVQRFDGMPAAYYADWVGVAADEARHFRMLAARLAELGHVYGDFDAHEGLWDMARRTAGSCLERMALVPRVLEARGLDVTPGMIDRLRGAGDEATVAILETILREEVAHVACGSRWFAWCCQREGLDPAVTFRTLLDRHLRGAVRGPFNTEARLRAGFSAAELEELERSAA